MITLQSLENSHEASQDQAEEASDDKDKTKAEVTPPLSTPFSFSSEDTEFDERDWRIRFDEIALSFLWSN